MSSVLVTGAAGFIGSHLSERLLADGHRVRGVDAFTPVYDRALKMLNLAGAHEHEHFEFVELDLATGPLGPLLDGVEVVFHLAARPGVRDSWIDFGDYVRANVTATKLLLDACAGSVQRFVYASSSSVYGNAEQLPVAEDAPLRPVSPYGATKTMTETIAGAYHEARGLETVGLRYFTVYGPRQRPDMALARFIERASRGEPLPIFGDGRQLRDFTFVGDAVAATVLAAERGTPGRTYNVACGQARPLVETLDVLAEVLGVELELGFENPKTGDVRDTMGDTTRARVELGFQAEVGIREGLERQVAEAVLRRDALADAA